MKVTNLFELVDPDASDQGDAYSQALEALNAALGKLNVREVTPVTTLDRTDLTILVQTVSFDPTPTKPD